MLTLQLATVGIDFVAVDGQEPDRWVGWVSICAKVLRRPGIEELSVIPIGLLWVVKMARDNVVEATKCLAVDLV
jgi:hypothetical protein